MTPRAPLTSGPTGLVADRRRPAVRAPLPIPPRNAGTRSGPRTA